MRKARLTVEPNSIGQVNPISNGFMHFFLDAGVLVV